MVHGLWEQCHFMPIYAKQPISMMGRERIEVGVACVTHGRTVVGICPRVLAFGCLCLPLAYQPCNDMQSLRNLGAASVKHGYKLTKCWFLTTN